MELKRICVFCGANAGNDARYADAARAMADALVQRGITLVFGGGSVGMMGLLADAVLNGGGKAIGVIPRQLDRREITHRGVSELHIVGSMHERKALMAEFSDGFVALPGGLGTLEELFEALTWTQLGLHAKPCGLLNAGGYFDGLSGFLDHAVREGFIRSEHRAMLLMERDADVLLGRLARFVPPQVEKWLSEGDQ